MFILPPWRNYFDNPPPGPASWSPILCARDIVLGCQPQRLSGSDGLVLLLWPDPLLPPGVVSLDTFFTFLEDRLRLAIVEEDARRRSKMTLKIALMNLLSNVRPADGAGPADGGAWPANGGAGLADGGARPASSGAGPANGGAGPANGGAVLADGGAGPSNGGAWSARFSTIVGQV